MTVFSKILKYKLIFKTCEIIFYEKLTKTIDKRSDEINELIEIKDDVFRIK